MATFYRGGRRVHTGRGAPTARVIRHLLIGTAIALSATTPLATMAAPCGNVTFTNGGYVAITPAAPTADDAVQITAAVGGFSVYDDPDSVVVDLRDNVFTIVLPVPDLVMLPPPAQCVPKIVGPLPVGTYRVDVKSRSYDSGIVTLHTSKQFTVAPSSPFPIVEILPAAPTESDAVRVRIMDLNVWSATHTVVGNRIEIKLGYAPIGNSVPWVKAPIGRLLKGAYDVTVVLTDGPPAQVRHFALAVAADPPPAVVRAVEFYHAGLDHYFMAAVPTEIDDLDAGLHAGWARTGYSFGVGNSAGVAPAPACRFYIPPDLGNSHFFSASVEECDTVLFRTRMADRGLFSPLWKGYVAESANAFYVETPDPDGGCPVGRIPVYRLWNNRTDSNHRYTTDLAVRSEMLAKGYVSEGVASLGVGMCAWP